MDTRLLLLSDCEEDLQKIRQTLRKFFLLVEHSITAKEVPDLSDFPGAIVAIDLKNRDLLEQYRSYCEKAGCIEIPKVFLVDRGSRQDVVQAGTLKARATVDRPADTRKLLDAICKASDHFQTLMRNGPNHCLEASQGGLESLQVITKAVQAGSPLPRAVFDRSAQQICNAVKNGGALEFLSAINGHHSYSYRHSMHVAGLTMAFADHLGFGERDKTRMVLGALMHDIGKARIPLELLDKETPLTPEEQGIVRTHASLGYEILKNDGDWDPLTLKLVHEHHEYLNGTGYPRGLSGDDICDPVRMLTIVDVFSALVDKRSYKDPMSPRGAMQMLYSMTGCLDMDIVRAFEPLGLKIIEDLKAVDLAA
ncbi:MAG: HD domain-containing phosphohydrolase [Pseudomonadota bacterium]